jgi:hypothetical protein
MEPITSEVVSTKGQPHPFRVVIRRYGKVAIQVDADSPDEAEAAADRLVAHLRQIEGSR